MREKPILRGRFSPITVTAALSLAVLLVVVGWQFGGLVGAKENDLSLTSMKAEDNITISNTKALADDWQKAFLTSTSSTSGTSTDNTGLAVFTGAVFGELVETYLDLKTADTYTPERAAAEADNLAQTIAIPVSFEQVAQEDIRTHGDLSYEGMLKYRADLRIATEPLLLNTDPEFEIFARYIETGDPAYLNDLRTVASRYRAASENAAKMTVPKDVLFKHTKIVNALLEFATTLEAMTNFSHDPIASIALLRAYNTAERNVFTSFNELGAYYRSKKP